MPSCEKSPFARRRGQTRTEVSSDWKTILLDTDHLSVLKYDEYPRCRALRARMNASEDSFFATTIVSAEEQMRGWLAKIHAAKVAEQQVAWYE